MSLTWKLIGGATVGGVAIFAGTGALSDNTTRDPAGEITAPGGVGAFVVRVGDCLQMPSGDEELVASFEGVPCETPHGAQVFAKFTLPELPTFPGSAQIQTLAADGCLRYWPSAIGTVYETDSQLEMIGLYPTQESWDGIDDREVACLVTSANGSLLIGSELAR